MPGPSLTKANTKYPIFAAAFAHNNPAILTVGGGGGAGRSGVPNSITSFDTSSRAPQIEPFANLELSREEDSVTCLAPLSTKEGSIIYAGINSSDEERTKGNNAHFRAFDLTYPKKQAGNNTEKDGKLEFISKTQLFQPPSSESARKDGYQRLIRLSPPSKAGGKRIGVTASSLKGNENELVIFPAVSTKPASSEIIQRIPLKEKEANDVDIIEEDGYYQVAYCLDYSVYVQRFKHDFGKKKGGKRPSEPTKRYEEPYPDVFEKKSRPIIRALRWLSSSHILLLINRPKRTGVELQILRLYGEDGMGSIIRRKTLGGGAKQAVDMDVVRLKSGDGEAYQILIAIATQDVSLHVYTVDAKRGDSLSGFSKYSVYQDVHDVQMTKIAWSPYSGKLVRLASTSLSGSITIDTFELQAKDSRHVLSSASGRTVYNVVFTAACAIIVLMLAIMVQSLIDPEGKFSRAIVPKYLQDSAIGFEPPGSWMEKARRARLAGADAPVAKTTHRIRDLLHLHHEEKHEDAPQKAVVINHDPDADNLLSTEVHTDSEEVAKKHNEAKRWEELTHEQRKWWKNKLTDAGMWTVEEGETILKSIFFGQVGGLVGEVFQGVMNG